MAPLQNATYHAGLSRQMVLPRIRPFRLLAQSKWGCNNETFLRYNTAFIRPVIAYARPLLLTCAKSPMNKADVRLVSCLRIVSGSGAHARVANLSALLDIPPI